MEEQHQKASETETLAPKVAWSISPYKPLTIGIIGAVIGGLIVASMIPLFLRIEPKAAPLHNRISTLPGAKTQGGGQLVSYGSVAEVAKVLKPSVVNIRTERTVTDFFGTSRAGGVGSGVIISSDGYIITNEHVVSGADEIWVTIGAEDIQGQVVGTDPLVDIAVVKVARSGLDAAKIGSAKNLEVGQTVVAIGSPLGFEHSVTTGVVSALNRTISLPVGYGAESQTYTELIQTDAAINPGNSGGALANLAGEVIGINSLLVAESYGQGLGFAISIDLASDVADQLILNGKASHPYMGANGQTLTRDIAESMSLKPKEGAILAEITKNGPAAKAGLKRGDIIVEIAKSPVSSMDDFVALVRSKKVGERLEVVYYRDNKRMTTQVTLKERP